MSTHVSLIDRLRSIADRELARWIPPSVRHVAIVGFPNHANVGDSAIWLGELAFCRARHIEIAYTCERRTYSPEALQRSLRRNGIILLHGGGNFGDLWLAEERLREQVLIDFPETPVIQLPQSIHFRSPEALERAKRIVNSHKSFVLLVRDLNSLAFARKHFSAPAALCPDMAFWLGHLSRPCEPSESELWLWRTDVEAPQQAGSAYSLASTRAHVEDWLREPMSVTKRWNRAVTQAVVRHPRICGSLRRLAPWSFERLAQERVTRGCRLLASAQTVVTNRLHAHILCLLMNVPHVVMDNNYGKVRGFVDTWRTTSEGLCAFEAEIGAAQQTARRLMSHSSQAGAPAPVPAA